MTEYDHLTRETDEPANSRQATARIPSSKVPELPRIYPPNRPLVEEEIKSYGFIERLMRWGTRTKRQSEQGWSIHWFRGPYIVWSKSWRMFRFHDNGYGFNFYKSEGCWQFNQLIPIKMKT